MFFSTFLEQQAQKHLHYYWTNTDMISQDGVQDTSEKLTEGGMSVPGDSHLTLESSPLIQGIKKCKQNVCHATFGKALNHAACSLYIRAVKRLTHLIQQLL